MHARAAFLAVLALAGGAEARDSDWRRPAEIDLLSLIDPKVDVVEGTWTLDGGVLVCAKKVPWSRIQIPYTPPDEYDLVLVAERREGLEAINIGLVRGDVQFHVVIDGFAFKGHLLSGLSRVDRKTADANETTHKGPLLTNHRPARIVCRVRKDGVSASVDGKTFFDWKGDFKRLSNHPMLKMPAATAFYLNAYECIYRFPEMKLVPYGGLGRKLR